MVHDVGALVLVVMMFICLIVIAVTVLIADGLATPVCGCELLACTMVMAVCGSLVLAEFILRRMK